MKLKKFIKEKWQKRGVEVGWKNVPQKSTDAGDGYKKFRPWQAECYATFVDTPYWIMQAPPSAGKTMLMMGLAYQYAKSRPDLLIVIACPQDNITKNFQWEQIEFPDGEKASIKPTHDLTKGHSYKSSIEEFGNVLNTSKTFSDPLARIIICNHPTLSRVFKEHPEWFKNVFIMIDEGHHVKYGIVDGLPVICTNSLGDIVAYALDNLKLGIYIGLATGTYGRGDRNPIIPQKHEDLFDQYILPYDKFFKTLKNLRSFSSDLILHQGIYTKALTELFDAIGVEHSIVYLPYVNSYNAAENGKYEADLEETYKAIAGNKNPTVKDQDAVVTQVKRGSKWIKVVNLADNNLTLRKERFQFIKKSHETGEGNEFDVIIALGTFKEGSNWKFAEKAVIIGQRNSLPEVVQINGRLFRDASGKTSVATYYLLRTAIDTFLEPENVKENLNNYIKAVYLMLLQQRIYEVKIDLPKEARKRGPTADPQVNPISAAFGLNALTAGADIMKMTVETYISSPSCPNRITKNDRELMRPFAEEAAEAILSRYHAEGDAVGIAEVILRDLTHMSAKMVDGLSVDGIDIDLLKQSPVGFVLSAAAEFTTGVCGSSTFDAIRTALREYQFATYEEAKAYIHEMRKKGQPLNTREEYQVWVQADGDYNAVLEWRKKRTDDIAA